MSFAPINAPSATVPASAPTHVVHAAPPATRGLGGWERARHEFPDPRPLSQLHGSDDQSWVWHGYLASGHLTLLTGLWKAGKTTLICHLLKTMEFGGDLAGRVRPGNVLVFSEESDGMWRQRRQSLGLGDHIHLITRPFLGRPSAHDWNAFTAYYASIVKRDRHQLVIIDTFASLSPCDNENDAAKMQSALLPLHRFTESGAAVLLLHHPRKGDGAEFQASRGSGALPGFVDIIMEFRRLNPEQADDRRRVIRAIGRFDQTPPEMVIELTDYGFITAGTRAEVRQGDRLGVIGQILKRHPGELNAEGVLTNWPSDIAKPGERAVRTSLEAGFEQGLWQRTGSGMKGDPFAYQANDTA